jgi:hypothetical protein
MDNGCLVHFSGQATLTQSEQSGGVVQLEASTCEEEQAVAHIR